MVNWDDKSSHWNVFGVSCEPRGDNPSYLMLFYRHNNMKAASKPAVK